VEKIIDLAVDAKDMMIKNRDPYFASTAAPAQQAATLLNQIGSILQTRDGDRYIFSGTNYNTNPLSGSLASLPAVYGPGAVPGVTPGYDVPFQPVPDSMPLNQPPYLNLGADVQSYYDINDIGLYVDDNERISYGVSAVEPGFQRVIDALLRFRDATADLGVDDANYQVRVDDAMQQLDLALRDLKSTASRNGYRQQHLAEVQNRHARAIDLLKIRIGGIQDADPAEVATAIAGLQTALEASYVVTSRMLKLSLVNYL
jgi:flagellar hook-associated protein 3 FlgL